MSDCRVVDKGWFFTSHLSIEIFWYFHFGSVDSRVKIALFQENAVYYKIIKYLWQLIQTGMSSTWECDYMNHPLVNLLGIYPGVYACDTLFSGEDQNQFRFISLLLPDFWFLGLTYFESITAWGIYFSKRQWYIPCILSWWYLQYSKSIWLQNHNNEGEMFSNRSAIFRHYDHKCYVIKIDNYV